jgi:4-amino-4-deoxy-L-arabinose transferase-like glycosyltransferase
VTDARWWAAGLVVLVVALGLRLAYIDATPNYPLRHDALDYDAHARSIAAGDGYSKTIAHGRPTAFRPPGYPYLLAGVYRVAGAVNAPRADRVHAARVAGAVLGALVVGLVGLLAAQLWGRRTALLAAALAAVYVPLITVGGAVMSEMLFVVLMLGAVIAAVEHRRSAHRYRFAVLAGVLGGLAVLTRANGIVVLLPLAAAVWDVRPRLTRAALLPPVVLVAVALLTITPWTIRNAVVLHSFVPITTQLGSALAGTYNDQARNDRENPAAWRSIKHIPAFAYEWRNIRSIPEVELERRLRTTSLEYITDHPAYVAEVGFWNTVRLLDLAGLPHARATAATVGIERRWADAGVLSFWGFAAVALAGALTSRARSTPAFVWALPVLLAASVVFLTTETPRYRTAIEPFVILLAALAASALARRLQQQRRPAPPDPLL